MQTSVNKLDYQHDCLALICQDHIFLLDKLAVVCQEKGSTEV